MTLKAILLGFLLAIGTAGLPAQSPGDEQALRQRFANLDTAWNHHDAHAITNPQTAVADADYINLNGGWVKGREPFVAVMSKLQAGPFHDIQRRTVVEKIRFVRPDVAVVITTNVDRRGDGQPSESRSTYVLSKEGSQWLLNSFQNTKISAPPGAPIGPGAPQTHGAPQTSQYPLTAVAPKSGEDQAIQVFFADSDKAWNNHNAQQLTNPENATIDADFINVYGGWAKGQENFVPIMTALQAGPFHDVHRNTMVEKVRFVRPDVAVVITTIVDRHGDGPPAQTRGCFVLSQEKGRWLLNDFQNTIIDVPL